MIKYLGKSNTMKKGSIFILQIDHDGEEGVAAGAPGWPVTLHWRFNSRGRVGSG